MLLQWYGWKILCIEITTEVHIKLSCLQVVSVRCIYIHLPYGVALYRVLIPSDLIYKMYFVSFYSKRQTFPVLTTECGIFCPLTFPNNYLIRLQKIMHATSQPASIDTWMNYCHLRTLKLCKGMRHRKSWKCFEP